MARAAALVMESLRCLGCGSVWCQTWRLIGDSRCPFHGCAAPLQRLGTWE